MKTFKQLMNESANQDHHDKAVAIVQKHSEPMEASDAGLHVTGVHPDHVAKLHASLKKAGFKQREGTHHPEQGASSGDSSKYHQFTKGGTTVHVAEKKNTWGESEDDDITHHHAEVHTPSRK